MQHKQKVTSYTLQENGQGLLEAVIALGIIITGVIAALTLAIANLSGSVASETRIVGANLAREGVEVARNIRDSNWIAGASWDASLADGTYLVAWNAVAKKMELTPVSGAAPDPEQFRMYHAAASGLFMSDGSAGDRTRFSRRVTLAPLCAVGASACAGASRIGIRVSAQVGWDERGATPVKPQVHVVADLYQWR
ncbi:hypothetical protein HY625_01740 [Candidatus Uhrbacteria bacterium]|nr:hypothetical protein [Candidatus Uhrbacteria bacterium]